MTQLFPMISSPGISFSLWPFSHFVGWGKTSWRVVS